MDAVKQYWIEPDWPVPNQIRALTTLRTGGCSQEPFSSWNLATHVDDQAAHVQQNRDLLTQRLGLRQQPGWLEQVHGNNIAVLDQRLGNTILQADGSYTHQTGCACVVLTADCLPVLITTSTGDEVAAVHAGWRGLADGVIEQAVACFQAAAEDIMVWLGPAIGPQAFEVGEEVRNAFIGYDPQSAQAFVAHGNKWLADLYQLARLRLSALGISRVYGGHFCTYHDEAYFYSYRREQKTGRMASLIWIEPGSAR